MFDLYDDADLRRHAGGLRYIGLPGLAKMFIVFALLTRGYRITCPEIYSVIWDRAPPRLVLGKWFLGKEYYLPHAGQAVFPTTRADWMYDAVKTVLDKMTSEEMSGKDVLFFDDVFHMMAEDFFERMDTKPWAPPPKQEEPAMTYH